MESDLRAFDEHIARFGLKLVTTLMELSADFVATAWSNKQTLHKDIKNPELPRIPQKLAEQISTVAAQMEHSRRTSQLLWLVSCIIMSCAVLTMKLRSKDGTFHQTRTVFCPVSTLIFKFALNMVHVTVEWWKNKNVVCVHLQTPLSFFFSLQFIQSIAFYWSFMHYDAEVTSGRSTRMWGNRAFGGRRFNFFFCGRCNSYLLLSGPDVPVGISLMS